jgi:hypothetical protein
VGVAVLLRRLCETGDVMFGPNGDWQAEPVSVWARFATLRYAPTLAVPLAKELQMQLNRLEGIHLLEDGKAGEKTSTAFFRVTGRYLPGDPRI